MKIYQKISFATIAIAFLLTATQAFAAPPCPYGDGYEQMPTQTIKYDGCTVTFTPCTRIDSLCIHYSSPPYSDTSTCDTTVYYWDIQIHAIRFLPEGCIGIVDLKRVFDAILDSCMKKATNDTDNIPDKIRGGVRPCTEVPLLHNRQIVVRIGKPRCVYVMPDTNGVWQTYDCGAIGSRCVYMYFICWDDNGNVKLTKTDSPNYEDIGIYCLPSQQIDPGDGTSPYDVECYSICE